MSGETAWWAQRPSQPLLPHTHIHQRHLVRRDVSPTEPHRRARAPRPQGQCCHTAPEPQSFTSIPEERRQFSPPSIATRKDKCSGRKRSGATGLTDTLSPSVRALPGPGRRGALPSRLVFSPQPWNSWKRIRACCLHGADHLGFASPSTLLKGSTRRGWWTETASPSQQPL